MTFLKYFLGLNYLEKKIKKNIQIIIKYDEN